MSLAQRIKVTLDFWSPSVCSCNPPEHSITFPCSFFLPRNSSTAAYYPPFSHHHGRLILCHCHSSCTPGLALARSSCPTTHQCWNFTLLPVSVNVGLGWTGTSPPFLCHFGEDSLCVFQLRHEDPFPAPKFFRLSQELDSSGLGVIFHRALWDLQSAQ
jgi:hypothetical protein